MNDYHRQQLLEQYKDAALSLLMDQYADNDGARLLQEFEKAKANGIIPEIPPELDEKCRKLIDDAFEKKQNKARFIRGAKRLFNVAACMLIILGICSVTVLSVEAIRVPVLNFFFSYTEKYTSLDLSSQDNTEPLKSSDKNEILDCIIPNDYDLVSQSADEDGSSTVYYQNSTDCIISLYIIPKSGTLNYDTEDATQETLIFLEYPAIFVDKEGYSLMWVDDKNEKTYTLYADGLDLDVFWELAYELAE